MAESYTKKKKSFSREKKEDTTEDVLNNKAEVPENTKEKKTLSVGTAVKSEEFGVGEVVAVKGDYILGSFGGSLRTLSKDEVEVV